MPHGLSCPKPSASSLETASHLGTRSGTRPGRGGTLLVSGLLLLSGRYAPGRPWGLLGGSPSLQGSNARQDRGGWLGPLQSKGCAPFLSCPTSQKASLCPSQDQCTVSCSTGASPALHQRPGGQGSQSSCCLALGVAATVCGGHMVGCPLPSGQ